MAPPAAHMPINYHLQMPSRMKMISSCACRVEPHRAELNQDHHWMPCISAEVSVLGRRPFSGAYSV